ncbi:DUF3592 domain-containing protein [Chitinivorax sp. PXF-14]|uniref:DUF3592 domain-containing protein n=1 Tax=Chitinivorax sp. PXF-14 TaxID=3230488 RepID=UPI0034653475
MFRMFRSPLIALCLIGFGLFLIYAGHKNASEFAALRDHGKPAEAEITKLEWKEKSNHNDSSYTAHVQFTTDAGREVHETMHLTTEAGRALRNQAGPSALDIVYLPESPTTFRDTSAADSSEGQGAVGRYMLLAGVTMLALRFFMKR